MVLNDLKAQDCLWFVKASTIQHFLEKSFPQTTHGLQTAELHCSRDIAPVLPMLIEGTSDPKE